MKLTQLKLRKLIAEELESVIDEAAPYDVPEPPDTRVIQTAEKNKIRLVSALMAYLDIDEGTADELLPHIETLRADN